MEIIIASILVIGFLAWRFRNFLSPIKENPKFSDPDWNPLEEMLKPKTAESKEIGVKEIITYLEKIAGSFDGWKNQGYGTWLHSSGIELEVGMCALGWMNFKGKRVSFLEREQINKIAKIFTQLVANKENIAKQLEKQKHLDDFIKVVKDNV